MKKTWKTLLASGALLVACTFPAQAASTDVTLVVDGQTIATNAVDGQPYISDNGRTMLPVRLIGELIDCTVDYDHTTNTVTVKNAAQNISAVFTVGAQNCLVNGQTIALDEPMTISPEWRAYVPFRALGEAFGDVHWDDATRTVTVTTNQAAQPASDWTYSIQPGRSDDSTTVQYLSAVNEKTGTALRLDMPEGHGLVYDAQYLVHSEKVIDGTTYLGIERSGVMGGAEKMIVALPDLVSADGQGQLDYIGTIPYKSDYTIVNGYIYYTDGTDQGPWSVDPNTLYLATVGDTTDRVALTVDFAINACTLSVANGTLIATEANGTTHEVARVPEKAGAISPTHMQQVLDANTTLEGFLESDDTLTFEEIAILPGASVSEE